MANKKLLINEIIDLVDENENLKREIKELKNQNNSNECQPTQIIDSTAYAYDKLKKLQMKLLFKEIFSDWKINSYCSIEVVDDGGKFNFLTFEQWMIKINISNIIDSSHTDILNDLNYRNLKDYFKNEFQEFYNDMLNKEKMEIVRSKEEEK